MRVLVTGGSGRIGQYVVFELAQAGHEVTSIDLEREEVPGVRTLRVDLTEIGQVYQAMARAKAQAVVHLGAWAWWGAVPDSRVYGENVQGTFNVFQACADLEVKRVVFASTHHVYGVIGAPPLYVPIDEDHPLRPTNSYALSKAAGEQAADYFVAQYGLEILSFRFMGVRPPAQLERDIEHMVQDPTYRTHLLWTRMDARDAAVFCRLAVETETVEPGPYNVTGHHIVLDRDSVGLVEEHFPEEVEIHSSLTGRLSPLSSKRAEDAFGYRPQYDWSVRRRYLES